jgi:hypothetical protein
MISHLGFVGQGDMPLGYARSLVASLLSLRWSSFSLSVIVAWALAPISQLASKLIEDLLQRMGSLRISLYIGSASCMALRDHVDPC